MRHRPCAVPPKSVPEKNAYRKTIKFSCFPNLNRIFAKPKRSRQPGRGATPPDPVGTRKGAIEKQTSNRSNHAKQTTLATTPAGHLCRVFHRTGRQHRAQPAAQLHQRVRTGHRTGQGDRRGVDAGKSLRVLPAERRGRTRAGTARRGGFDGDGPPRAGDRRLPRAAGGP